MPQIDQENKKRALISSRRIHQAKSANNLITLKGALLPFIGSNYIVQKDWANNEFPMYKEMHKVIDVEIKNEVVYFVSDVISLNNDLITGHNSIICSTQSVLPVVYEKCSEITDIFYNEIMDYYKKTLNKMSVNLNLIITEQLTK
jgi:hypothetical protein